MVKIDQLTSFSPLVSVFCPLFSISPFFFSPDSFLLSSSFPPSSSEVSGVSFPSPSSLPESSDFSSSFGLFSDFASSSPPLSGLSFPSLDSPSFSSSSGLSLPSSLFSSSPSSSFSSCSACSPCPWPWSPFVGPCCQSHAAEGTVTTTEPINLATQLGP